MNFKFLLFVMFCFIFSSAVYASEAVHLSAIRYDECVKPNDNIPIYVRVKNTDYNDIDDLRVIIDSPDIEIYSISQRLDLSRYDVASFDVPIIIPYYVNRGEYTFRVLVFDGNQIRRSYYRSIFIE